LLLALTGCRRTELLSARWQWIRQDQVPPVLILPREATKQKRPHPVMLSSAAMQVLDQLPSRHQSEWLFPAEEGGPRTEPKRAWQRIRARAEIPDVRIHDLRHAVGSSLGSAGENSFLIKRALGHAQLATTDRYVQLESLATHRALEDHAARLSDIQKDEDGV
jgi:integrase